jgi:hypothetical protein
VAIGHARVVRGALAEGGVAERVGLVAEPGAVDGDGVEVLRRGSRGWRSLARCAAARHDRARGQCAQTEAAAPHQHSPREQSLGQPPGHRIEALPVHRLLFHAGHPCRGHRSPGTAGAIYSTRDDAPLPGQRAAHAAATDPASADTAHRHRYRISACAPAPFAASRRFLEPASTFSAVRRRPPQGRRRRGC